MRSFNSATLESIVIGDKEKMDSERLFLIIACFASSAFLLLLCVVHMVMKLSISPVILTGTASVLISGFYLVVRKTDHVFYPKLMFTLTCFIFLDLTWYTKFLSNGPVLFFILIFGAMVLWVWDGKALAIILASYFLNILLLYFIDSKTAPDLEYYPDPLRRNMDIYLSLFLYSSFLIYLLSRVKKEFHRQNDKAERSDKLKSAFLANMSHEIRTPMNAIVGLSQFLDDDTQPENRLQYINIIQQSSDNLLRLINDIIDLSRIEAGDVELQYTEFRAGELFNELRRMLELDLIRRDKVNIKLSFRCPDEDLIIFSDQLRLKQILLNLLNNAVKFTSNGEITCSCEKKSDKLLFTVSDTGTGIPDSDKDKVFDHFTKFNYKGLNTDGSGIGLSIVKKLVTLLNGQVWFNSEQNRGSDFYFSIPCYSPRPVTRKMPEKIKPALLHTTGKRKILIVEDDRNSYLLIREILRPMEVDIHHVKDGFDALDFINNNPETSLVLMDIKMAVMDGYETTSVIRSINPDIPVIAQTAYAMKGDREKALNAGCVDYISKPIDIFEIQDMISRYIRN